MYDETVAARIPFVFILSLLVMLVVTAAWTARSAIHQQAAQYVEQEWRQRLNADIERGLREARSREQQGRRHAQSGERFAKM